MLVSETMLQQTRVEVVVPRFAALLRRWPTAAAMAAAREEEVVAAWSGLGYYGRARRLHAAARAIVERYGGVFPRDEASLRALPGVGPYTAGAVGSLALGLPLPLVDGNVARVLARLFAVRGDPRSGPAARRIGELAAALVPGAPREASPDAEPARIGTPHHRKDHEGDAGEWNEGLMELGALVCVPGAPRCLFCPFAEACAARRLGLEELLPERAPPKPSRRVRMVAAVVLDGRGRVLLLRRPEGGVLGGTYELPSGEIGADADAVVALATLLHERLGGGWEVGALRRRLRHSIMDRRITMEVHGVRLRSGRLRRPEDSVFAGPQDLADLPLSSLVGKALGRS